MEPTQNTIPLSKALEIAKGNPSSEFAKGLRKSIESGALDEAAQKQGVDLSKYGRKTANVQPMNSVDLILANPQIPTEVKTTIAEKVTDTLGLGGATQVFGDLLARQGIGTDTPKEVTQEYVEKPTGGQVAGAALQTAAVPAGFALTGGTSVLGQAALGAGLGYAYDVGSDLVEQKTTEEVVTPGVGTVVGATAPLALAGAGKLFNMAYGGATPAITEGISQTLPESAIANAVPETQVGSALGQTAEDITMRGSRAVKRGQEFVESQAQRQAKIANAPAPVKSAIRADVDEVIIDLAQNSDDATKEAMRRVVELAEAPKTARAGKLPTSVAGDASVEQYKLIEKAKKDVGARIGELSDSLPQAKEIPTLPAQRVMRDTLRQNGIVPMQGGQLRFENKAITPEQQAVVQKLYSLATSDEVLSARQIHQMDQLFSRLQRQSRAIDKVEDVYIKVPTPDGKTIEAPIFKVFRDIFSKQLDDVAPEFRKLNRDYATYSNLLEDFEGSLIKNKEFSDIVSPDGGVYAEAGLRRMFGEGVGAAQNADLYEALDKVSRGLGYKGARADELYYFGNKLRDYYPETVPETGLRKNISTSIRDVVGDVLEVGKTTTKDQQDAIKELLGFNQSATTKTKGLIQTAKENLTNPAMRKGGYAGSTPKGMRLNNKTDNLNVSSVNNSTPQTTALLSEAKKYKSAEEFVKAQGTPMYHGSKATFDKFQTAETGKNSLNSGIGFYLADNAKGASTYGNVMEFVDVGTGKLLPILDEPSKHKAMLAELADGDVELLDKLLSQDVVFDSLTRKALIDKYKSTPDAYLNILKKYGYRGYDIPPEYALTNSKTTEHVRFNAEDIVSKNEMRKIWEKANQ